MNKYIVTSRSIRIASGVLELTAEQARTRMHNLKHIGELHFEIINPVEFKHREVIGFDGELPKSLAALVEPEPPKVPAEPADKKKAK